MLKHHHPLPRLWLMTDERMGDDLLPSIQALPKGSGIIFRHYMFSGNERRRLFDAVRKVAKRRRHCLILAGTPQLARAWKADGAHGRKARCLSAPVHSIRERIAAERRGALLLLVSPLFETASHLGSAGLGVTRFGMTIRGASRPVIALGGMTETRARTLKPFGIYGWAAIDALTV